MEKDKNKEDLSSGETRERRQVTKQQLQIQMYKGNKVKTARVEGKTKQNKKKELSAKIPMTCPAGRMQSRTGYTA